MPFNLGKHKPCINIRQREKRREFLEIWERSEKIEFNYPNYPKFDYAVSSEINREILFTAEDKSFRIIIPKYIADRGWGDLTAFHEFVEAAGMRNPHVKQPHTYARAKERDFAIETGKLDLFEEKRNWVIKKALESGLSPRAIAQREGLAQRIVEEINTRRLKGTKPHKRQPTRKP